MFRTSENLKIVLSLLSLFLLSVSPERDLLGAKLMESKESFHTFRINYERTAYCENFRFCSPLAEKWSAELSVNSEGEFINICGQWPIQSRSKVCIILSKELVAIDKTDGRLERVKLISNSNSHSFYYGSASYDNTTDFLFVPGTYKIDVGSEDEDFIEIISTVNLEKFSRVISGHFYLAGIPIVRNSILGIYQEENYIEIKKIPIFLPKKTSTLLKLPKDDGYPRYMTISSSQDKIFIVTRNPNKRSETIRAIDYTSGNIIWERVIDSTTFISTSYLFDAPVLSGSTLIAYYTSNQGYLEVLGVDSSTGELRWNTVIKERVLYHSIYPNIVVTDELIYITLINSPVGNVFVLDLNSGKLLKIFNVLEQVEKVSHMIGCGNYLIFLTSKPTKLLVVDRFNEKVLYQYKFDSKYSTILPPIADNTDIYLFLRNKEDNKIDIKRFSPSS